MGDDLLSELTALLVLFPLALAALWVAKRRQFFSARLGVPVERTLGFRALLGALTLYLVAMVVLPMLTLPWRELRREHPLLFDGWLQVGMLVVGLALLIAYLQILPSSYRRVIWGEEKRPWDVALGVITWLIAFPVATFAGQVAAVVVTLWVGPYAEEQIAVLFVKQTMGFPLLFFCTLITVVVVVPITEELLFRGILQATLRQWLGRRWGILCSAAIFALFHIAIGQGWANIEIVVTLFFMGAFLGYLYERQHNLWSPIALHGMINGCSLAILFFSPES